MGFVWKTKEAADRWEAKVFPVPESGCWLWIAATARSGHGVIRVQGKNMLAHRVAWLLDGGVIPAGMFVCHKCDTPQCVNPRHLYVGTAMDNMRDMYSKGRNGHGKGEKASAAKLTEQQVAKIRLDQRPVQAIAKEYGVSPATISSIHRGTTWSHFISPNTVPAGRRCGSRHSNAKLDEDKVRLIRADKRGLRKIAADFGVGPTLVSLIRKHKVWTHVP